MDEEKITAPKKTTENNSGDNAPVSKEEEKPEEKPQEETLKELAAAKETIAKMEAVTKKLEETNKKMDEAAARALLAGKGVVQGEPKKLSDEDYSEKVEKGEANPLKEDGFI